MVNLDTEYFCRQAFFGPDHMLAPEVLTSKQPEARSFRSVMHGERSEKTGRMERSMFPVVVSCIHALQ